MLVNVLVIRSVLQHRLAVAAALTFGTLLADSRRSVLPLTIIPVSNVVLRSLRALRY